MSPFASQAQRRALWAENPELARRWEAETPKGIPLPEHVAKHGIAARQRKGLPGPRRPVARKGVGRTLGRK